MTVAELREAWLAELARTRKPATITHYAKRTAALVRTFGSRDLATVSLAELQQLVDRQAEGKAPDTVRASSIVLQQLTKWLVRRGHLAAPWVVEYPKPKGREREVLPTDAETKQLLAKATPAFAAIYRALRITGARPNELCRAQISDLKQSEQLIVLADHKTAKKTGKPRKISTAHAALQTILRQSIGDRTEGAIFLSERKKPWTVGNLSRVFRTLRNACGISSEVVLYCTRHEHATQLYEKTGDLKAVADALGHSNLQTSSRYTHTNSTTLGNRQQLFSEGLE